MDGGVDGGNAWGQTRRGEARGTDVVPVTGNENGHLSAGCEGGGEA